MNIPNLPTDNLYKFIALSGILLLLLSVLLPYQRNQELTLQRADVVGRVYICGVEIKENKRRLNYVDSLLKERPSSPLELERKTSELEANTFQLEVKMQELQNQTDRILILSDQIRELSNYSHYGSLSGGAIGLLGFLLWYLRVQRYQDKILHHQAKQAA